MKIQESLENYLETILILSRHGEVRSIDIAKTMSFSKPSVSVAVRNLRDKNLININQNGHISLTSSGLSIAEKTLEKHELLTDILVKLGVDCATAQEDACGLEHHLSEESFDCIKKYYNKTMK